MKKLIIFLILFLTSCTADIGDVRYRKLIITKAYKPVARESRTVYTASIYYKNNFNGSIIFSDDSGKYTVGDTIIIIKNNNYETLDSKR